MNPDEPVSALIRSQQELILRQAESIRELTSQIQELLSQVAWFRRQLFGRRSEKFALADPNQPSLFEDPTAAKQQQAELEEARQRAVREIEKLETERKTDAATANCWRTFRWSRCGSSPKTSITTGTSASERGIAN